jgi:hypothetical protein
VFARLGEDVQRVNVFARLEKKGERKYSRTVRVSAPKDVGADNAVGALNPDKTDSEPNPALVLSRMWSDDHIREKAANAMQEALETQPKTGSDWKVEVVGVKKRKLGHPNISKATERALARKVVLTSLNAVTAPSSLGACTGHSDGGRDACSSADAAQAKLLKEAIALAPWIDESDSEPQPENLLIEPEPIYKVSVEAGHSALPSAARLIPSDMSEDERVRHVSLAGAPATCDEAGDAATLAAGPSKKRQRGQKKTNAQKQESSKKYVLKLLQEIADLKSALNAMEVRWSRTDIDKIDAQMAWKRERSDVITQLATAKHTLQNANMHSQKCAVMTANAEAMLKERATYFEFHLNDALAKLKTAPSEDAFDRAVADAKRYRRERNALQDEASLQDKRQAHAAVVQHRLHGRIQQLTTVLSDNAILIPTSLGAVHLHAYERDEDAETAPVKAARAARAVHFGSDESGTDKECHESDFEDLEEALQELEETDEAVGAKNTAV